MTIHVIIWCSAICMESKRAFSRQRMCPSCVTVVRDCCRWWTMARISTVANGLLPWPISSTTWTTASTAYLAKSAKAVKNWSKSWTLPSVISKTDHIRISGMVMSLHVGFQCTCLCLLQNCAYHRTGWSFWWSQRLGGTISIAFAINGAD